MRARRRLSVLRRGPRRVKEAGSQLALFRALVDAARTHRAGATAPRPA